MKQALQIYPWLTPGLFLLGGLILGWIVERIVLSILRKVAARTAWRADDLLLAALRHAPTFWCFLAGCYGALLAGGLPFRQQQLVEKVLLICLIVSLTTVLSRFAVTWVRSYTHGREGLLPTASILVNVTRVFVLILGLLTILHALGVSITPALTALGIGGLAVALALQDSLSNLFSGLQILIAGDLRPGDLIKLESGDEGTIEDITWRCTTIRTLTNNLVIIPNSKLAGAMVTNFHRPDKAISFSVQASVRFGTDLERVEAIALEVGREVMSQVPGGVPDFQPVVRFQSFSDSGMVFTLTLRAVQYTDQYLLKHECMRKLYRRFVDEGIEIGYPNRIVYMKREASGRKRASRTEPSDKLPFG